jgi:hypothetical protein
MWNKFTLLNYTDLKLNIKKYIDLDSIYFKETCKNLLIVKSMKLVQFKIEEHNIKKDLLLKLISSAWVDKDVQNNINKLDAEYLITWSYTDNNTDNNNNNNNNNTNNTNNNNNNKIYLKCTNDKFNKIKKRLPHLLRMIEFIKNDNTENLTIYLFLSDLKKKIDNNIIIKPKNINSGYTDYTDIYNKFIFIWREEEFEKVLFHELVHFYNIDHRDETYTNFVKFDSLYEAITDFKGITFNLIYLSIFTNIKIENLMNYEFSFINNQAIMINNLINNNIKLISPAFSYYVLKMMLINYIISSKFSLEDYNDLFKKNIKFDTIITKLININKTTYHDFNSARMTFIELE